MRRKKKIDHFTSTARLSGKVSDTQSDLWMDRVFGLLLGNLWFVKICKSTANECGFENFNKSFLTILIIFSLGCNKQKKQFDSLKDTHLSTHMILIFQVAVVQLPSLVWCFVTPWTAARQASLSLTISKSLYSQSPALLWLHGPGIEPGPPMWPARIIPLNHSCTYFLIALLNILNWFFFYVFVTEA